MRRAPFIGLLLVTACCLLSGGSGVAAPGVAAPGVAAPGVAAPLALAALPSPTAAGASAFQLAAGKAGPWLSWVEADAAAGKALRVAQWRGSAWSAPTTIVASPDLLAHWADVPAVVEGAQGELVAHWLRRRGEGYGIELMGSRDHGATWQALGPLPSDSGPSEHGFVAHAPLAGGLLSIWLDGRALARNGATALYAAAVGDHANGETVLDDRVCDCCSTAAAVTSDGAVVAYRDRSADETRDIAVVRYAGGRWQTPRIVHADGWTIRGCPVNGPAIAAHGSAVVVAWYTAAGDRPRVLAARSNDSGATFAEPVTIDDGSPFGRVGVAVRPSGEAVVSWLGRVADGAELRLRRVSAAGAMEPAAAVATFPLGPTAGTPRPSAVGDHLLLAWADAGGLRLALAGSAAVER